ncbi:DMT family transporter [Sphingobium boeckii]|uniref:Drug/metabolite transporter (DMT)-like permease n=1 Tax=Sphingobium boeckii TaxID=1082345 RepID=A0A7W9EFS6_9SPHN|nr:DMT family transporter [Sphingobium boeckii]MBB5686330.1 drug/metabolite transporter (DMT)-like permease [Sphingobium boeckii]
MSYAIAFGLMTALFWGVTDLLAQRAARAAGVVRTMIVNQALGCCVLGLLLIVDCGQATQIFTAPLEAWAIAIVGAFFGIGATLSLFRALALAQVASVVPIVASYGAVTTLLAIASGDQIRRPLIFGLIACISGAILTAASQSSQQNASAANFARRSIPWSVTAAILYGFQFFLLGREAVPVLGPIAPVMVYNLTGLIIYALKLALVGSRSEPIERPAWRYMIGTGFTVLAGYVAISAGMKTGHVAVVTVLSSFQSPVTVVLAWLVFRDRISHHQAAGLCLIVGGLICIHVG